MSAAKHPFSFVLDELAESVASPRIRTRSMFGSLAVYVDEKIVFMLRRKQTPATLRDDGIWVASLPEFGASLRREFPSLRPIELFESYGKDAFTGWWNLPEHEEGFEGTALELCRLVTKGDPRIGKVPKGRKSKKKKS
jgi:hypothetical protein